MTSARVSKTEVIVEFRQALIRFSEESAAALLTVDMEIRRMLDWLGAEQPRFWKQQIDLCREQMSEVKSDLARKRLANVGGHASLVEEKDAVAYLKRKSEYAEEKLAVCRKWATQIERAINEYRGSAHALSNRLEIELPKALAALQGMSDSLDAYINLQPPTSPRPEPASGQTQPEPLAVKPAPDSQDGSETKETP